MATFKHLNKQTAQ